MDFPFKAIFNTYSSFCFSVYHHYHYHYHDHLCLCLCLCKLLSVIHHTTHKLSILQHRVTWCSGSLSFAVLYGVSPYSIHHHHYVSCSVLASLTILHFHHSVFNHLQVYPWHHYPSVTVQLLTTTSVLFYPHSFSLVALSHIGWSIITIVHPLSTLCSPNHQWGSYFFIRDSLSMMLSVYMKSRTLYPIPFYG